MVSKKYAYFYFIIISIFIPPTISQLDENFITLKIRPYYGNSQILNDKFNILPSKIYLNGNITNVGKSVFTNSNTQENIVKIAFNETITNISYMFSNCNNILSVDLLNFDFSYIEDMSYMFAGCSSLLSINISNLNASSSTNMNYMFAGCSQIQSLDLSYWNIPLITQINNMFYNSAQLQSIDLSYLNAPLIKNLSFFFNNGCGQLKSIGLSHINAPLIKNLSYFLYGCNGIKLIDLSYLNAPSLIQVNNLCPYCAQLESINISYLNAPKLTNISYIFKGCSQLKYIDLSNLNTPLIANLSYLSDGIYQLKLLNLSNLNLPLITNMSYFFMKNNYIDLLDLSNFNAPSAINMSHFFYDCSNIKSINLSNLYAPLVKDMSYSFYNCYSLNSIDFSNINISSVKNASSMFRDCKSLSSIDLSFLNNSHITNFNYSFANLKSLNFSYFVLPFVTDMYQAFYGISSLNISHLQLLSITDMSFMFAYDKQIEFIDFSYLYAPYLKSMNNMFYLSRLKFINLANLNAPSLISMNDIFSSSYIESINLSNLNFPNVKSLKYMFNNCNKLTSVNLYNTTFLSLEDMSSMFGYCYSLNYVNMSYFYAPSVIDMQYMFHMSLRSFPQNINDSLKAVIDLSYFTGSSNIKAGSMFYCFKSLKYVNLSYFNGLLIDMNYMFKNCESLIDVNFLNLNTSSVTNMYEMLYSCSSLTSLNLSSFSGSSITNMDHMFSECTSLEYIDLSNFITVFPISLSYAFKRCTSLISIDLSSLNSIKTFESAFEECTSLISIKLGNLNYANNMNMMFWNCKSLQYFNLSNFDLSSVTTMYFMFYGCSSLIKVDLSNLNIAKVASMQSMFVSCSSLIEVNLSNITAYSVYNMENMFSGCDSLISLDFSSFITKNISNLKQLFYKCNSLISLNLLNFDTSHVTNMEKMFYECNSLLSLDLSSFNTSKVKNMNEMFSGCNSLISLDLSNFVFSSVLNVENMFYDCNSLEYIDISKFENVPTGTEKMFYGVKDNLVYCIRDENKASNIINQLKKDICKKYGCSDNYDEINKKLIIEKNQCIDECANDETYQYQYKGRCYITCPEGTNSKNDSYLCEEIILEETNIEENEFQIEDFFLGKYKITNKNNELIYKIINSTINEIQKGKLNSLIKNIIGENKEDYLVNEDTEKYQLTSAYNQKNKNFINISTINLGDCENKLKERYNIDDLILFKFEYLIQGLNIPIIKFNVFDPYSNKLLDLNYCNNTNIYFNIPVSINENELFLHDPKSDYYNNICYTYTTLNGTDITLKDRKNDYNIKNMSLCEKNCDFYGYDFQSKNVICECNIEKRSPLFFKDIINQEKLLNNFIDIKSITNINVMKCYELLFSRKGIINNIGNYILLSIISISIILSILFYFKGYKEIMNKIKKIMYLKKKKDITDNQTINNNSIKNKEKSNDILNKSNSFDKYKNIIKIEEKSYNNEKYNSFNLLENEKKGKYNIINVNKKLNENEKSMKLNNIKKYKNIYLVENYNDYELNTFSYKEASEKDKRTFLEFYISLIKEKHLLIFSFYPTDDYNSMIMKINFFFFSFALYYIVNSLFFTDSTMHKIYVDEGIFDFLYFIPIIIYSTIISSLIQYIMKALSLSESDIMKIKKEKNYGESEKIMPKIVKCLIIKFICFFIFSFLLLILFWYYISCFCAVYKNTQFILIKDTLISFALSMIYPFFIYLLPGILRIPILTHKKKCLNVCYKINKFI